MTVPDVAMAESERLMSGENAWRVPPWALPAGVGLLLSALYALGSLLGWGGAGLAAWTEVGVAAAAAGSLFIAFRGVPGRPLRPAGPPARGEPSADPPENDGGEGRREGSWRDSLRWFTIAAAAWAVGAFGSALTGRVISRSAEALSLSDLFFIAAVAALAAGFVLPARLPRDAQVWVRYAADTYVCVAALFVLGWVVAFSRLYHLSDESPGAFLLELLYPLGGTIAVCGVLPFVLGATRGHRPAAWTAYLALTALVAADVVSTVVRLRGGPAAGDPGDIARIAGLLLLGMVPWIGRDREEPPEPSELSGPAANTEPSGRMFGPGIAPAAVAAAAALFVAGHAISGAGGLEPAVTLVAGSAALVLLARLAGLLRDNDRLRRAVDAEEEHFRALAESINDVVLICEYDGTVRYVSAGVHRTYDYHQDELLGRSLHEIVHPEDLPGVEEVFTNFLAADWPVLRLACRVRAADGTWLPTESTVSRYTGNRLLVTTRDLSEQAALRRQVTHLTFHDGLTGLPNRAYFEERAREVLPRTAGPGRVAVLFVDLDGFTAVNDSAGHAAGDQVLAQAARRLRAAVQAEDTVARWGGDEFAVLVEDAAEAQTVVELAERLLRVLSAEPYRVGDRGIALSASVGLAFADEYDGDYDGDGPQTGAELIRNGDLAMARAKERGGGRVEVFAAHMHADVVRRLELGSDLQRALAEERFAIEFQPVVELATSRVTGVEALVRWWRGSVSVPPQEFIGRAEESGLMIPLGDWVLREACREVARWRAQSWDVGLSVNFTARQIAAPRFVESVAAVLDDSGLPPQALTLEVKEEVLVEDAGHNVERLSALRELGVRLAIDDFGTGYASLAYLGQLPVDVIKIDPSFVAGLGRDETLTLLTRTIVRLGSDLGLVVVAEGIERPEQLELLREMDCPRGQGFLVARPMAPGRAESLIRTGFSGAVPDGSPALSTG
jgi:diguanylate cyclase (GGDEF)-like protein/PAS domain S-box-containing protein